MPSKCLHLLRLRDPPTWLSYPLHPQRHRGLAPRGKQAPRAQQPASLQTGNPASRKSGIPHHHSHPPEAWTVEEEERRGTLWDLDAQADPRGT